MSNPENNFAAADEPNFTHETTDETFRQLDTLAYALLEKTPIVKTDRQVWYAAHDTYFTVAVHAQAGTGRQSVSYGIGIGQLAYPHAYGFVNQLLEDQSTSKSLGAEQSEIARLAHIFTGSSMPMHIRQLAKTLYEVVSGPPSSSFLSGSDVPEMDQNELRNEIMGSPHHSYLEKNFQTELGSDSLLKLQATTPLRTGTDMLPVFGPGQPPKLRVTLSDYENNVDTNYYAMHPESTPEPSDTTKALPEGLRVVFSRRHTVPPIVDDLPKTELPGSVTANPPAIAHARLAALLLRPLQTIAVRP